ncbi:epimerase [Xaviernesmea oryzae]|uniref:Epimerase n=1 Tax=Xaviernesmea oryzae TaxID=464029 RepID=A0A1Q9AZX2_9HYPH|nr:NAD(P)-dependent oxidoreductase [Xaviernesmea oryzae]OLP61275.1 epimerase [Xaviernesmea oryzae]SEL53165.1 Nucleoside-diphosphate-sugar epimerase [Xaviernesmea oryzae]
MRVLVTGSSGRIGAAIVADMAGRHAVIGLDLVAGPRTGLIADLCDIDRYRVVLEHVDAVVHAAGVHAPHVGVLADDSFHRINVEGTRRLAQAARQAGVSRFVFTSTTAVFGGAEKEEGCRWITETTQPRPRSIYHRSKLEAEALLAAMASPDFSVCILRMSRCFPERADVMALYRLHRGIDARDVACAHRKAMELPAPPAFDRLIISAATPFLESDAPRLGHNAPAVLRERAPGLVTAFLKRGWSLPQHIDRIYVPLAAQQRLGWRSRHGFETVLLEK